MRQNFIQLDFIDKQDAKGNKNIIVRLVNKDGTFTECVTLWELLDLAKDIEFFKESYAIWNKTIEVHAASRKKRLVERLARRARKYTALRRHWRKRAAKLASGAIEVKADVPPTKKNKKRQKSSLPPQNIDCQKRVMIIVSESNEKIRGTIKSCSDDRMLLKVRSLWTNETELNFKWNGTQYISERTNTEGDPLFVISLP